MEETYWWFVARRRLVCDLIDRLAMPAKSRLLDVGCGTGANLKAFDKNFERVGIDMSRAALGFCQQRGLDSLVQAKIEHSGMEHDTFDIVTALDMLEHVDDDMVALRELWRVSKPGGFLLITVPALDFFGASTTRLFITGDGTRWRNLSLNWPAPVLAKSESVIS